jgi:hypothetical protein
MPINMDIITHLPGWRLLAQTFLLILGAGLANFFVKLYRVRRMFQRMQKEGLVSLHASVHPQTLEKTSRYYN